MVGKGRRTCSTSAPGNDAPGAGPLAKVTARMSVRVRQAWSVTAALVSVLVLWPAVAANGATMHAQHVRHSRARPLLLTQSGVQMRLASFRLDGRRHQYTFTVHSLQVTDERTSSAGWRLTGAISRFAGLGGGSFRATAVVVPECSWAGGTQAAAVAAVSTRRLAARPVSLCAAGSASGSRAVSRLFEVEARLTVTIPAYVASGHYSAVLTFTLLSDPVR
jgi:hypothetical protein